MGMKQTPAGLVVGLILEEPAPAPVPQTEVPADAGKPTVKRGTRKKAATPAAE